MACSRTAKVIHTWLDGGLGEAGEQSLHHHLLECPECREEADEWKGFLKSLEGLPLWEEPPYLLPAIMSSLSNEPADKESWVEPLSLFGLFGICAFSLLRLSGSVLGQLREHVEMAHNPAGIGFSWVVVGLMFGAGLSYMLLHKRLHAKFL